MSIVEFEALITSPDFHHVSVRDFFGYKVFVYHKRRSGTGSQGSGSRRPQRDDAIGFFPVGSYPDNDAAADVLRRHGAST